MVLHWAPVPVGCAGLTGGSQCTVAPPRGVQHLVLLALSFAALLGQAENGERGSLKDDKPVADRGVGNNRVFKRVSGTGNAHGFAQSGTGGHRSPGSTEAMPFRYVGSPRSDDDKPWTDKASSHSGVGGPGGAEWLVTGAHTLANTLGSLSVPVPEGVTSDTVRTLKGAVRKLKTAMIVPGAAGEIGLKRISPLRGGLEGSLFSKDGFGYQRPGRPPPPPKGMPPRSVTPFLEQVCRRTGLGDGRTEARARRVFTRSSLSTSVGQAPTCLSGAERRHVASSA